MGRKATGRRDDESSHPRDDSPSSPKSVKVTLHLTFGTAQRLAIESAMRRISQSAIAEEVLSDHLSHWQLPINTASDRVKSG